ncbi:MAG: indolepyruvate ferredoxin oxidoreductase subunit alpha [Clostridia bacterium]|nr:indolepyruvate ferredoxin oxidoreductase subunit alpha [Clostridia bacterium]
MGKRILTGNNAIAFGALTAGVNVVCGYPGTPSTEILETIADHKDSSVYVEWSANGKAALEVAAGASIAGARTMVALKQSGLNDASDSVLTLAYMGIKGGMVIVSADDAGPHASHTEQDTRSFAALSRIPIFDPSSPEEAYEMIGEAFRVSELYGTPVILRPTTRVCLGKSAVFVRRRVPHVPTGFEKDPKKWVPYPKNAHINHIKIEKRNPIIADMFSELKYNSISGRGKIGVAVSGISCGYVREALEGVTNVRIFTVGTPYPFPEKKALEFLRSVKKVLVIEELDPVIERELTYLCGKHGLKKQISGKLDGAMPIAGEYTPKIVSDAIGRFVFGIEPEAKQEEALPVLPVRTPTLCAGCPHRASLYAVKQALKGKKYVCGGDVGCSLLGSAAPLEMIDTCLSLGAGITLSQGIHRIQPDTLNVAFMGDSSFFATGFSGIVNATHNEADLLVCILDNSASALTGQQPHPGSGMTMMGSDKSGIDIEAVLRSLGLSYVKTIDPMMLDEAIDAVRAAADVKGVRAIVFKSPCAAIAKPTKKFYVSGSCVACKKCIRELGCPAILIYDDVVRIDSSICNGCGLCAQICQIHTIKEYV